MAGSSKILPANPVEREVAMKIKPRKVRTKTTPKIEERVEENLVEDEGMTIDMTDWEQDFDYSDMSNLFCIIKGHCGSDNPVVNVKNRSNVYPVSVGSYDPNNENTVEHYCVVDRITFYCTYGGGSLEKALDNIKRVIVRNKNNPENYFREVSDATNEDFYFRHYENQPSFSSEALKRRAEEGRSWRVSDIMKAHQYAVISKYGVCFEEAIAEAYEGAVKDLADSRERTKQRRKKAKKKIKLKLK